MMRRLLRSVSILTIVLWFCAACGGSSDDDDNFGQVRLINATEVSNLVLNAQGNDDDDYTYSRTAGAPGEASGYADFKTQSYSINVSAQDGSLTASSTGTLSVSEDDHYGVVAYERGDVINLVTLGEEKDQPSSGYAKLTVINAGTDAGTVDVYLVSPGSSLDDRSPVFSALSAAGTSLTQSQTAGTYDLVVTASNKSADVRLRMSSIVLDSQAIVNIILTPTSGGALLDGVFVRQQGSVQLYRNTSARVRLVAGLANDENDINGPYTVRVTVGADDLGDVVSPSPGTYTMVSGGTTDYSVSVNGTAVSSLPAATFATGGDYTILVYDSADPKVTVLTDKNQLPTSGAKIRLVNAALADGVSLSVNYVPLFSQVAQGRASEYSGISSGSTKLMLSSPAWSGYKLPPERDDDGNVSIASGGVYSYFILGSGTDETTTLNLTLNRDR